MTTNLKLTLGQEVRDVLVSTLIIAGWAGRDKAAVEAHIHELEELGVPRPKTTPVFYKVGADCLTTEEVVDVLGEESSGEVETVLVSAAGKIWVGVGSDHTDRGAERIGVALSKQLCPKPVGKKFWLLDDVIDHWDELVLTSYVIEGGEEVVYQSGSVAGLLHPSELLKQYGFASLPEETVMFCGTLSVQGGIRPRENFRMELRDPQRKLSIEHHYRTRSLSVVS